MQEGMTGVLAVVLEIVRRGWRGCYGRVLIEDSFDSLNVRGVKEEFSRVEVGRRWFRIWML